MLYYSYQFIVIPQKSYNLIILIPISNTMGIKTAKPEALPKGYSYQ